MFTFSRLITKFIPNCSPSSVISFYLDSANYFQKFSIVPLDSFSCEAQCVYIILNYYSNDKTLGENMKMIKDNNKRKDDLERMKKAVKRCPDLELYPVTLALRS